jgi:hypothetical protein
MFIITDENMLKTDFEPLEDLEILTSLSNLMVVRTWKLLPALQFMQECGWKLWELTPDDEDWIEYNILTFYKKKNG